jgi:hypothetical protein
MASGRVDSEGGGDWVDELEHGKRSEVEGTAEAAGLLARERSGRRHAMDPISRVPMIFFNPRVLFGEQAEGTVVSLAHDQGSIKVRVKASERELLTGWIDPLAVDTEGIATVVDGTALGCMTALYREGHFGAPPESCMAVFGAMQAEEIKMLGELQEAAVGTLMALGKTVPAAKAAYMGMLQAGVVGLGEPVVTITAVCGIDGCVRGVHLIGAVRSRAALRRALLAVDGFVLQLEQDGVVMGGDGFFVSAARAARAVAARGYGGVSAGEGGGGGGAARGAWTGGQAALGSTDFDKTTKTEVGGVRAAQDSTGKFSFTEVGQRHTFITVMGKFKRRGGGGGGQPEIGAMLLPISRRLSMEFGYKNVEADFVAQLFALELDFSKSILDTVARYIGVADKGESERLADVFQFLADLDAVSGLGYFTGAVGFMPAFKTKFFADLSKDEMDFAVVLELLKKHVEIHCNGVLEAMVSATFVAMPNLTTFSQFVSTRATAAHLTMTLRLTERARDGGGGGGDGRKGPRLDRDQDRGRDRDRAREREAEQERDRERGKDRARDRATDSPCWPFLTDGKCLRADCRNKHVRAGPRDTCPYGGGCRRGERCLLASTHPAPVGRP